MKRYDEAVTTLRMRWDRQVSLRTQIGCDSIWQRLTLCLETHRLLLRYGPAFSRSELLRISCRKLYGKERVKHQTKSDMKMYHLLEQEFGEGEWPPPVISRQKHKLIAATLDYILNQRIKNKQ